MNKIVKNNLRYVREYIYGIDQLEFAKMSGIRRQTIEEIETGMRTPNLYTALKISDTLGCKVNDIFTRG